MFHFRHSLDILSSARKRFDIKPYKSDAFAVCVFVVYSVRELYEDHILPTRVKSGFFGNVAEECIFANNIVYNAVEVSLYL